MNMKSDEFNEYLKGLIYDIKMAKMQEESQAKIQKKWHYDKYTESNANNLGNNADNSIGNSTSNNTESAAAAYEKIFEAVKPFVYKHGRKIIGKYNRNSSILNTSSFESDEFETVNEWQEHLQNLYIEIYNCVNRFDIDKNVKFTFYATTCIRNYFYNYAEKQNRIDKKEKSLDVTIRHADLNNNGKNMDRMFAELLVSDDEGPEEKCIRSERSKILGRTLKRMSEEQRRIIYYYYSEEMTLTQIAELFGQPYHIVRHLRTKALEELRRELD